MKKLILILIALAIAGVFLNSCSDEFIDKEPAGDLSNDKALASYDKLVLATNGLYACLMLESTFGEFIIIAPDVMADNVRRTTYGDTGRYTLEYNLTYGVTDGPSSTYRDLYYMITAACNIINRIESGDFDPQAATPQQLDYLLGEALFIRALGHFELCNFFAHHYTINDQTIAPGADGNGGHLGVPIVLEAEIAEPARNTVNEVYNQVIEDLTRASELMGDQLKNGSIYASSYAAKALLARVYLYKEDWANAVQMANDVINSGYYFITPEDSFEEYWKLEQQPETILEVEMNMNDDWFPGGNNNVGGVYLFYGDIIATESLVSMYDDDDVRKSVTKLNENGEYSVYKYPGKEGTEDQGFQVNNSKILRLSEMFLIRAEANQKAGTSVGETPLADINFLRINRGLTPLTSVDADDIALERQKELAFEGHRIFDLAREKKNNIRPKCLPTPLVNYPDHRFVYPIPLYEMDNNTNMVQNPGF